MAGEALSRGTTIPPMETSAFPVHGCELAAVADAEQLMLHKRALHPGVAHGRPLAEDNRLVFSPLLTFPHICRRTFDVKVKAASQQGGRRCENQGPVCGSRFPTETIKTLPESDGKQGDTLFLPVLA